MVSHIEILVEEPSMEAALRVIVPKMAGDISFQIYPYQCKEDLLVKLPSRLRGYSNWLPTDWRIVVILDRDNDSCVDLKGRLDNIAVAAGLRVTRAEDNLDKQIVNRLAIEELEAWFFGDWEAVRVAYPRISANIPRRRGFRDPDAIAGGTWEALERVLNKAGYFETGLRKIEAARAIALHMEPDRNLSKSFRKLLDSFAEMVA